MQEPQRTASSKIQIPLGPNKIQQALADYDHMESELAHTKTELKQYVDIANKMSAQNEALKGQMKTQSEFLTRQIDMLTAQRNRLQRLLTALLTRFSMVHEIFERAEAEAREEAIEVNAATSDLSAEDERALKEMDFARRPVVPEQNKFQ